MQVSKLHKLLKPFLLRRIKSDVEDSLPAKQEILLYADMTKEQKTINQQLCDRSFIVSRNSPPAPWCLTTLRKSMYMPVKADVMTGTLLVCFAMCTK